MITLDEIMEYVQAVKESKGYFDIARLEAEVDYFLCSRGYHIWRGLSDRWQFDTFLRYKYSGIEFFECSGDRFVSIRPRNINGGDNPFKPLLGCDQNDSVDGMADKLFKRYAKLRAPQLEREILKFLESEDRTLSDKFSLHPNDLLVYMRKLSSEFDRDDIIFPYDTNKWGDEWKTQNLKN